MNIKYKKKYKQKERAVECLSENCGYLSWLARHGHFAVGGVLDRGATLVHQSPVPRWRVERRNTRPAGTNPLGQRALWQHYQHSTFGDNATTRGKRNAQSVIIIIFIQKQSPLNKYSCKYECVKIRSWNIQ